MGSQHPEYAFTGYIDMSFRPIAIASVLAIAAAGTAFAVNAPSTESFSRYADPEGVVLAVSAGFAQPGGAVRLSVYDDEAAFLEHAAAKHEAQIGEDGVAVVPLGDLSPGAYAFVAYYDENGDGRLNRGGILGKPKEPYAFSNGVNPKLRQPRFDEAKVEVDRGSVVVLKLDD
ncbi:MAG: DUF2141 domain-containing protein [Amphiplicatus sp.]